MDNKKFTFSLIGLVSATLTSLFAINKTLDKIASSKNLLSEKNNEIYHWRFGDISYHVSGEGKPILLIHDLKEDSSSVEWSGIVHNLSRTNTVYSVDLLGCGLSDRPFITYTSYMYTQLINDFIRNIIKKKTSVVVTGKSVSFVLGACHINEEAFEELILINPENIHSLNKKPCKRTKTAELILKSNIIGSFIYHMMTARNIIEENFEEKYFYDRENIPEALIDYYYESAHLGGRRSKNLYLSLVGRYGNANIIGTLKSINHNIHILAGRELPGIESIVKEYQYYNPAIEAEYIDYTRKLPQLEKPEEILKFIHLYTDNIC